MTAPGAGERIGGLEVEVFNAALWNTPGDVALRQVVESYRRHVAEP